MFQSLFSIFLIIHVIVAMATQKELEDQQHMPQTQPEAPATFSMNMFQSLFSLFLITATMAMQQPQHAPKTKSEASASGELLQLTPNIAGFTCDLYDQLSKQNPDGNLLFSPFSITTALGMTLAGTRGNTRSQLAKALKLKSDDNSVFTAFRKLLNGLGTSGTEYTLSTANGLFVDKKFKVLEEFLNLVKTSFQSEVTTVNFAEDIEGARSIINQWVEKETNSKIKDLISPGMLSPDKTVLVLVNAIYLKANWQNPFSKYRTRAKDFETKNGKKILVDMMYQEEAFQFGHITDLDCQILELPYVKKSLSMFVLLPNRSDGLSRLEENLTPAILQSARSFVTPKQVAVHLPKFKLEEDLELSKVLQQLWITDLFSKELADLSGIDGTKKLYVANVIHKTFIDVNEKGTEAAAATGVHIGLESYRPPQHEFNADHPFLFFIQHNPTGAILFVGRLSQPE